MKIEVKPCAGVQKAWASYSPADSTIILWDGPGTAIAIGYIEGFAPVRKGHWILDDNRRLVCSECGCKSAMSRQFVGAQYKSKYCPNCGALMDKKDGEQVGKS